MSKNNIPILMYHSTELMPKSTVMRGMHVPPNRFYFQMLLLKILGFKGLSMRELQPYLKGKKSDKVVGITFDDGYLNNLKNAAPVLKKFNFSATCFIVSECIGRTNIWDKPKGINQRPLMSNDEIRKWLASGMDIGAHTQTHVDLTSVSKEKAAKEINRCKDDLEDKFDISIVDFCYPFGKFDDDVCNQVKMAGFSSAVTMIRGRANKQFNELKLPRIPITYHTLPHLFLIKILSKYEDKRS
jgi:peptidoglycan/xylan/chitin deacetylase (PgdA/CDA1 family)